MGLKWTVHKTHREHKCKTSIDKYINVYELHIHKKVPSTLMGHPQAKKCIQLAHCRAKVKFSVWNTEIHVYSFVLFWVHRKYGFKLLKTGATYLLTLMHKSWSSSLKAQYWGRTYVVTNIVFFFFDLIFSNFNHVNIKRTFTMLVHIMVQPKT
jgi:hypothetical protein